MTDIEAFVRIAFALLMVVMPSVVMNIQLRNRSSKFDTLKVPTRWDWVTLIQFILFLCFVVTGLSMLFPVMLATHL